MAIAVAADPRAEAQPWKRAKLIGREACIRPCKVKAFIKRGKHAREDFAQVVHHVATLVGERGFFQKDLACSPQAFEGSFDFNALALFTRWCLGRVACVFEQRMKRAMVVENGKALRLRGVRCEHWFDADAW